MALSNAAMILQTNSQRKTFSHVVHANHPRTKVIALHSTMRYYFSALTTEEYMNDQATQVVQRLQHERGTYGRIAQIAKDSGVTSRTLYLLMAGKRAPSAPTLDKLSAYFKKADRKAKA